MKKFLLATAVAFILPASLWPQGQPSPDTQQQAHPDPSPQAHQPATKTGMDASPQTPDQQQENTGTTDSSTTKSSKHSKRKNNARQAKGTPKPTATSTDK